MRIDVHGHFTTAPPELDAFRGRQLTDINKPRKRVMKITDQQLEVAVSSVLEAMRARAIDVILFSPRASGMGHDYGGPLTSRYWTEVNNDLIARVVGLFPDKFVGVGQLPQSPGTGPIQWIGELTRIVDDLNFVGCLINPDISGGLQPFTPSLADEYWYPLWEKMCELEVAGMVHASSTHNPAFHLNGSHYIAWDYGASVELAASKVFDHFPGLQLIVPHGGGGIPFQFNRNRALHVAQRLPPFEEAVRRIWFDTALYDPDSLGMLIEKIGSERVLFGTEMFGTAKGIDPETGRGFDDVGAMLDSLPLLDEASRRAVLVENALRAFPRLGRRLESAGLLPAGNVPGQ